MNMKLQKLTKVEEITETAKEHSREMRLMRENTDEIL